MNFQTLHEKIFSNLLLCQLEKRPYYYQHKNANKRFNHLSNHFQGQYLKVFFWERGGVVDKIQPWNRLGQNYTRTWPIRSLEATFTVPSHIFYSKRQIRNFSFILRPLYKEIFLAGNDFFLWTDIFFCRSCYTHQLGSSNSDFFRANLHSSNAVTASCLLQVKKWRMCDRKVNLHHLLLLFEFCFCSKDLYSFSVLLANQWR